ncbi:MAG: hypothetical protein ACT4OU_07370 [Hyphomicrobium sp.]
MRSLALAGLVAAVIVMPVAAHAQSSGGMDSMHDQRREGGRVCMIDHFHYGSGSGKSKQAALADAIGSWQSFTDFEYGGRWASWKRSASKEIKYGSNPQGITADISSRPCR